MGDGANTHHGTAIAVGPAAALILGPSGSGKSDLALRCLTMGPTAVIPEPAVLVADDRVHISRAGDGLSVWAPDTILGRLEVRGLGIVQVAFRQRADLVLAVELTTTEPVDRLPDPPLHREFEGVSLPLMRINPREASSAAKVLLALTLAASGPATPWAK